MKQKGVIERFETSAVVWQECLVNGPYFLVVEKIFRIFRRLVVLGGASRLGR